MSSDGYFSDFDDAVLEELDAIESKAQHAAPPSTGPSSRNNYMNSDSDIIDLTFDIDESELQKLDAVIEDKYNEPAHTFSTSNRLSRTNSKNTVQTTLFGGVVQPQAGPSKPTPSQQRAQQSKPLSTQQKAQQNLQRTNSGYDHLCAQKSRKTKQWDHTEFAKSGWKRGSKGKGKTKADVDNDVDEDIDEGPAEFEQFPAPFMPSEPPAPMKLALDLEEAKTWVYPLNHPKRDYQYNIVKHCFFDNTLVCLPTGLGKTFIAGVVMLNFYRWFPEGKVVFVAPTKPLVAQQIEACHKTCGIPGKEAVELTGEVARPARSRAWHFKRIFYMTPQTLLNDLITENCDARDIVLLVIDEAHRGTGDYAYAQVIRYLMSKNTHFRVLALSATPGGRPEVVQAVVDSLHISRIEARDENSIDLKPFLHQKDIQQHIVTMSDDINKLKTLLVKVMNPVYQKIRMFIPGHVNLETMGPFRAQAAMSTLKPNCKWACGPLAKLSNLARAMGYLIEGTVGMCHSSLLQQSTADEESGKQSATAKSLKADVSFQALMKELERMRIGGSFPIHPKMDLLKTLLIQHLGKNLPDGDEPVEPESETKVMIFVSFREAVEEVVEALNQERPIIRATKFIGQGTDKKGNKGMTQKDQLNIIKQFKQGIYNVLVATSIGEEGLDIGEIDLIVCYDSQKSSIRMLQRIGRTGRKRNGTVHVLLAESREELNFEKAKDSHKHVLKSIWDGANYEFYDDVDRLIPKDIKPQCIEKVMEIEEYNRDESNKRADKDSSRSRAPAPRKKKRDDDILRNIPPGASTGFVSVAELVAKGAAKHSAKRKKIMKEKDFDEAGEDDDTDLELEAGFSNLSSLRRSKTDAAVDKRPKKRMRKAASTGDKARKPVKKGKAQQKLEESDDQSLNSDLELEASNGVDVVDVGMDSDASDASSGWGSLEI